jgi:cytochrome c biogenesis protein CcmG, thiol:disulfide interchange protein DsbE
VSATAPAGEGPPDSVVPAEDEIRTDRRWRVTILTLVPIVALAALLGFGLGRDPREVPNALVGQRAPVFALKDLRSGRVISMADLLGHPVVINFWASWCIECVQEHPNLLATWRRYGDAGVVFLSIVYQDSPGAAAEFEQWWGKGWPDLEDPGAHTALNYGVRGVPETFFIDRRGIIRFHQIGPSTYALLDERIRAMPSAQGAA